MSFESFVQQLTDSAGPLAMSKLVDLSDISPEDASFLGDSWLEIDVGRRRQIVQELLDLGEDNVELNFDRAFLIALADRDPDVRREAIRGLWEYEGRELVDSLVVLLEDDSDAGVRAEAALALGRFVALAEFDSLRSVDGERVEEALQRIANDEQETAEVRGRAIESLGARSSDSVRDLIEEMFDSSIRRLRLSALHAMGRSCDAYWLPTLLPELESDDPETRFEAAVAAGSIADETSISPLIMLLEDDDSEVQEAAIAALGEIGSGDAKEALEELLTGDDERISEAVHAALAEIAFADDPLVVEESG